MATGSIISDMRKLIVVIIVVALLAAVWLSVKSEPAPSNELINYQSVDLGWQFAYPKGYLVTEKDKRIILTTSPIKIGSHQPNITFEQYPNREKKSVPDWLKSEPRSNFSLSSGRLEEVAIGQLTGLLYRWAEVYHGETVAVAAGNFIYLATVTYQKPTDQIRADLAALLPTIIFTNQ